MAIALNKPLEWLKASADEQTMLHLLQGNILKGHGRENTANIFFRFRGDTATSRRLVRALSPIVTNALTQLKEAAAFKASKGVETGGPFVHLALSKKGYDALEVPPSLIPDDPDFQAGMKHPDSLTKLEDKLGHWFEDLKKDFDGVLVVADVTEGKTAALAKSIRETLETGGAEVIFVQHGKALKNAADNGIEHFGYVDGRSQPLMLVEDIGQEASTAQPLGWDPAFPLDTALVQDKAADHPLAYGSYFIFRKLEQNVLGFKRQEQELANRLHLTGEDRELAGALIVGRFEDGTPVTTFDEAQGKTPPNDFSYQGHVTLGTADDGIRCPLHAHIRKANPRGTGKKEPENDERRHIMARRGIPYEDVKRAIHPDELPDSDSLQVFEDEVAPHLPARGVGLLFMAYNRAIGEQFAFVQENWVNSARFPGGPPFAGIDPVIGQSPLVSGQQMIQEKWNDTHSAALSGRLIDFPSSGTPSFVTMRGGEYFFSPSIEFLKNI